MNLAEMGEMPVEPLSSVSRPHGLPKRSFGHKCVQAALPAENPSVAPHHLQHPCPPLMCLTAPPSLALASCHLWLCPSRHLLHHARHMGHPLHLGRLSPGFTSTSELQPQPCLFPGGRGSPPPNGGVGRVRRGSAPPPCFQDSLDRLPLLCVLLLPEALEPGTARRWGLQPAWPRLAQSKCSVFAERIRSD